MTLMSIQPCFLYLTQEPLFAARVIYDLLFFFMVIIIVLNLIFGVIIDTFADLRSEKQKKEEILKTSCFICGKTAQSNVLKGMCCFFPYTLLHIYPICMHMCFRQTRKWEAIKSETQYNLWIMQSYFGRVQE